MSEKRKRRKWKLIIVLLLLLLAAPPLFVWIVKVRSDRAWNEFVAKWEARGEHFDIAPLVPPKVPDADNLALHPSFAKAEDPSKPGSTDPHADFFPGQIETLFNHPAWCRRRRGMRGRHRHPSPPRPRPGGSAPHARSRHPNRVNNISRR